MKKYIPLVVAICTIHFNAFTQNKNLDLLKKKVDNVVKSKSGESKNAELIKFIEDIKYDELEEEKDLIIILQYAEKLADQSDKSHLDILFIIGDKLLTNMNYQDGYSYLYRTKRSVDSYPNFKYKCRLEEKIGQCYYYFMRLDLAAESYRKAIQCENIPSQTLINAHNTLGLIYVRQNDKRAEHHYRLALDEAQRTNNNAWVGIVSGNIGQLYHNQGRYHEALQYLQLDVKQSLISGEKESAIGALSSLLKICIHLNEHTKAKEYAYKIDSLIRFHKMDRKEYGQFRALSLWEETNGNFVKSLQYLKRSQELLEKIQEEKYRLRYENIDFQLQFEKKQSELELLEREARSQKREKLILTVLLFTIAIASFISIKQILKRKRKEKELLKLQTKKVQDDLDLIKVDLVNVLVSLREKNEHIQILNEKLLHTNHDSETQQERVKLSSELHSFTLLTDDGWIQFKHLFESLHPNFLPYLQLNFPGITNAETRLAALLKLNLDKAEISKILGISPESVRKTNLRLRKRLDIANNAELMLFIHSI